eukprot:12155058-Alexandrium_andersonii.AAC.2
MSINGLIEPISERPEHAVPAPHRLGSEHVGVLIAPFVEGGHPVRGFISLANVRLDLLYPDRVLALLSDHAVNLLPKVPVLLQSPRLAVEHAT